MCIHHCLGAVTNCIQFLLAQFGCSALDALVSCGPRSRSLNRSVYDLNFLEVARSWQTANRPSKSFQIMDQAIELNKKNKQPISSHHVNVTLIVLFLPIKKWRPLICCIQTIPNQHQLPAARMTLRSHEVKAQGYRYDHDGAFPLITVFSAPNYVPWCDVDLGPVSQPLKLKVLVEK